jgi:hypothetical protein
MHHSCPAAPLPTCANENGVRPSRVLVQEGSGVVHLALVHEPRAVICVVLLHLRHGEVLGALGLGCTRSSQGGSGAQSAWQRPIGPGAKRRL